MNPLTRFLLSVVLFRTLQQAFQPCLYFAHAWDSDGHQAIGMTAMSTLSSKATSQVKRLMGGKDVVDVAGWAHRVEVKYPKTVPLHFQYQPTKWDCAAIKIDETNCPENHCLVRTLQHFYGRLTSRPNLVKLTYPEGLQLTDSDAVKYLVNLLGDLHQPLHCGFQEDLGGQNISFVYNNQQREKQQTTMYSYWDSNLVQKFISERPAFWYGGWTHAHSLGSKLKELQDEWDKEPSESRHLLFERWAVDSLQKACNQVYKDPRNGGIIPTGYEPGSTYEYLAMEMVKSQILTAGARTAFVLNTILTERDAVKLRQGSGIEVPIEDESVLHGVSASSQRYFKSFCINVVILVVVLSVFAYVTKFYSPVAAVPGAAIARTVLSSKNTEKRS